MPLRRLDPRVIADICDVVELKITEKVKSDFRSEMELMKNDMITEVMRAIVGMPRNLGTNDSYEEVVEDFEAVGSSGDDQRDRSGENRIGRLHRSGTRLSTSYQMEVSTLSSTLRPKDLID